MQGVPKQRGSNMLRSYRFCVLCGVAASLIALLLALASPFSAA
jgi:hypothetical protein